MSNVSTLPKTADVDSDFPVVATDSTALILDDKSFDRMMAVAKVMATGRATIPQHLRNEGDCLAVIMQAMQWGLNPWAVAQKTHVTQGGALGYEAQLINAVIIAKAPIKHRPDFRFIGDWSKILGNVKEMKSDKGGKYYVSNWNPADEADLGVICSCHLIGEDEPREITVMMSQAWPRFSTQWATDPQQQITYLAVRKWSRRYAPDVILGVNTTDELEPIGERDMGPADVVDPPAQRTGSRTNSLKQSMGVGQKKPDQPKGPALKDVLAAIEKAHNGETMAVAKSMGEQMPDGQDKYRAVAAYRAKVEKLKADALNVDPETGEVTAHEQSGANPEHDDFVAGMDEENIFDKAPE